MSLAALCAVGALALAAAPERAERLDHRGSIGVLALGGVRFGSLVANGRVLQDGLRIPVDLGVSVAPFASSNELQLWARAAFLRGSPGWGLLASYRSYFGEERWKTFVDVGLSVIVSPVFEIGPRLGFGVMVELMPQLGAFAAAGAEVGGGNGFHFAADVGIGLQLRTYLLE